MKGAKLVKSEIRALITTRMPFAFLVVLGAFAALNAALVVWGSDADGTKTFVSTALDQASLVAFSANSVVIAGLFGATAVARGYGHGTVVHRFLATPRRSRAVLAQFTAVALGGAVLGLAGVAMTAGAVAAVLPTTEFGFLISTGDMIRLLAASSFAGAAGALLGGGIGALVRNTGGAVTGAVLVLVIAPPLVVQIVGGAARWIPPTLANVVSGVSNEVTVAAAITALVLWAGIPTAIGLVSTVRRDVV
jgi:ABC-type transport system involved in multi-copper enzyme maturation permease subunit